VKKKKRKAAIQIQFLFLFTHAQTDKSIFLQAFFTGRSNTRGGFTGLRPLSQVATLAKTVTPSDVNP